MKKKINSIKKIRYDINLKIFKYFYRKNIEKYEDFFQNPKKKFSISIKKKRKIIKKEKKFEFEKIFTFLKKSLTEKQLEH